MCRAAKIVLLTGFLVLAPAALSAQLSAEGRLGAALPTGHLSDSFAEVGYSLGLELDWRFMHLLSVYAGLSRDHFGCLGACDGPTSFGFQAGLRFRVIGDGRVQPWLRAGLIGQSLDTDRRSDLGLGFEVGAGTDIPLSARLSLVPAAHFRRYPADWDGAQGLTARYFMIGLGLRITS
jgi:hypothetical protein